MASRNVVIFCHPESRLPTGLELLELVTRGGRSAQPDVGQENGSLRTKPARDPDAIYRHAVAE
ncbi:MAG: hypothetical protein JWN10_1175 [Solirubrobacterales bacterium]|nr:hypothetical protein [Solirubrobacterales bacterium]